MNNNIDQTIDRLLSLRLTKFQFGFVSGLRGHPNPSRDQREKLASIASRYTSGGALFNEHTERPDTYEHADGR
jgi:hypothetical protein